MKNSHRLFSVAIVLCLILLNACGSSSGNADPDRSTVSLESPSTTELSDVPSHKAWGNAPEILEPSKDNKVLQFKCPDFAYLVSAAINIPVSEVTAADLYQVKSLDLSFSDNEIELDDLIFFPNLEELSIRYIPVKSIDPIKQLKHLHTLCLTSCNLTDISALEDLVNLRSLDLAANNISDITPLSQLTRLVNLDLSGNQIIDISPLKNLTGLVEVDLTHNQITDVSPLTRMTALESLRIYGNTNIYNGYLLKNLKGNLKIFEADFSLNILSGKLFGTREAITCGNLANESAVNTDGSYLYYMQVPFGDIAHPSLCRRNLKTYIDEDLSGSVNEQLASLYSWEPGNYIIEYFMDLNCIDGKLYYYTEGYNTATAGPADTETGYSMGLPFNGIVSMNTDGSNRKLLKQGTYSNIVVDSNRLYYLNEAGQIWSMNLDGKDDRLILDGKCNFFYPTDDLIYILEGQKVLVYNTKKKTSELLLPDSKMFILHEEAIYSINREDHLEKLDLATKELTKVSDVKVSCFNISNQYIFYSDLNHSDYLYRMDMDGRNSVLVNDEQTGSISVLGDYVFVKYVKYLRHYMTMMKYDGTEWEVFFYDLH